ncbi:non-ribosomal peptide synthetase [Trichocladium antarcticum]|uniref:Non-ribosomal peptide synthetase n=1 Tax=Trichocladium antarcticum TaxID=1450529 RepID=A0AAN6ZD87_9PEZI|nr:non-ribosomal peptide synthetase [Trichocladium antarcticum]
MLAVLRAGGAFVPMDSSHPVERLRMLCSSVKATLMLCSSRLAQTLAGVVDIILPVDDVSIHECAQTAFDGSPIRMPAASSTDAAYVIFTSGSTGKPKGTVIEHRSFCSSARAHAPALRIDGTCRVLQFAAHTFDASLVEILTPLMVGACVCIPSEDERLNDLAGAISRLRVDHAVLTPSFVNFLTPAAVPGLRRLVLAGEAMSPAHVATWSYLELVNGYGPAESSVAAVVNSRVGPDTEANDIGVPCGVRCWLVDPADHHSLVPIGCAGEMLLEGPSLARGYLNDPSKTDESFVLDPVWSRAGAENGQTSRRFYKTGDLGRYNSASGSLSYIGRKDTQIKLHGQRIELGEIEHHLAVDERVQHAMVILPKLGPLAKRLVTVVSLSDYTTPSVVAASAAPDNKQQTRDAALRLTDNLSLTEPSLQLIRARLGASLPEYMIPSTWLCVETIPMLPSRKMDRKTVAWWVENVLSAEECQKVLLGHRLSETTSVNDGKNNNMPLDDVEATLRDVWSLVLNLPADQISPDDHNFLSLGGDSISAMSCMSHAMKARLRLTVQDILRAKSLRHLAATVKPMLDLKRVDQHKVLLNTPFDLSPIQQLHFDVRCEAQSDQHFNQSFCFRLARHVEELAVENALRAIIQRHPMLRARFAPSGAGRQWRQYITADVDASYRFRVHAIHSRREADAGISSAQECLDVRRGPLFAAELFSQRVGEQLLFMTAHHLVVDLVSWRVILEEMEEMLENPLKHDPSTGSDQRTPPAHLSLPFPQWTALQAEDCVGKLLTEVLPAASQVPAAHLAYWGMQERPNLYGDVVCQGFELDVATTATLLSECHSPFRTETVDLLLAALIWSFQTTFTDRSAPAMFNEGHGRELPPRLATAEQPEIDISRTVGWFTTLFPVALSSPGTFSEALIQTKDLRRRVPGNGRPYFAVRFHTPDGRERWRLHHRDMEVSFNFLGRYQQLERAGALFQPAEGTLMAGEAHPGSPTADFGQNAPRFSLFEVSAVIVHGALRFGFAWNTNMSHQSRIVDWVNACHGLLTEAAATLPSLERRTTASDLVLAPDLTPADFATFERTVLPTLADSWDAIEDIYPTSPIQQGLLLSRTKDGHFYAVRRALQVKLRGDGGRSMDVARLVQAWKDVVRHHALLRTIFIDAIAQTRAGSHDQVVLAGLEPLIVVRDCPGGLAEMHTLAETMDAMNYQDKRPQHRFSVLYSNNTNASNTVLCVLEMSHAIMDGASMDILLRDLGRAYDGALAHVPKPLFSPFVATLQQRSLTADIAFWTNYLAGVEPCHFPVLTDGVTVPESERKLCSLRVKFPGLQALQAFCTSRGFTLPNAFHAAWGLTLACYTGTDDVCFGYLVSGRDATAVEGSEDAVGPFINMATQRVKFGSDGDDRQLSLLHVLDRVQRDQLECMPYAQASLAEVQHALNIPGGMALFETCLSYRRQLPSHTATVDGSIVCEYLGAIQDPTEYPISLNIEIDNEGRAAIDLDYWTDSVATAQANHIAAAFLQVLSNIVGCAETPIAQLDNVHTTSKELIWKWNANMPPTTVACVHHMVQKQVALRPQAQAIRGWDGDFSYEEMGRLSSCLARHLMTIGVGPETLVPVCFDKSSWTVIAMLAVLKAGGGVVPLDATHPANALEGKVTDAGAHVVVASEARASLFETIVPMVVAVGPELLSRLPYPSDTASFEGNDPIQPGVSPEHPAFVMFTSGSTGKPKGVVLCHQALVSSALAHGSALGLGPHTRFLQFAAHTFDNSLEEMFTTLIHGGCVCVPSEADRLGDLPGAIDTLGANFMDLTPTVAALLRPEQVPTIQGMAVGGEALTREVLELWGGAIPVHNQYGPSECSINAAHRLHMEADGDVANIGTSVGSVSWVVDPDNHDRLMPVGCVGELIIEGPILARGYLGRPVETSKSFIEMPKWALSDPRHIERGSRRMYKTGDLVRYNSDGSLVFFGRKDTQVKLHGQRIELGEIEHHVRTQLPPNAQSSVELLALGQNKKALAVFFCVSPPSSRANGGEKEDTKILPMGPSFLSTAQSIVGAMASQVASYMVPSLFLPVSSMPLTSSGKLDRRRLRTMAHGLSDDIGAYRLGAETPNGRVPETPTEKQLQELWATVLGVAPDSITADDSFFSHGGDSIGAMRLVAAARQKGVVLAVANIFKAPKLSDMAKLVAGNGVDASSKAGDGAAGPAIQDESIPGPVKPFSLLEDTGGMSLPELQKHVASICRVDADCIDDMYPSTPLQAGLVAASLRGPGGAYVASVAYELPIGTDVARFKRAWQEVVDSEAILRTRVVFVDNVGFLQAVVRTEINWTTVTSATDLSGAHYRQLPPHDGGILCRYIIIDEHSSRPTFIWMAHHALYDGWSLPTLLSRVEARYQHPETPVVPSPHYSRFVEYLSDQDLSVSDAFWTATMAGFGTTTPQHFPQLPHPTYHVQATSQVSRLVHFARPKGSNITRASFLRVAWALLVSTYSSSDEVVFGEVLSGRDVPVAGIKDMVGPTLTTVPRRIHLDRSVTLQEMLDDVQVQLNSIIPHQFSGLQRIKALNPPVGAACEFQNLFAIDVGDEVVEDGLWSSMKGGDAAAQGPDFFSYPLNVTCTIGHGDHNNANPAAADEIHLRAFFDAEVVPKWQVARILGQFEALLLRLSARGSQRQRVGDVDLLSLEDKMALRAWNENPGPLVERRVDDMICEKMTSLGSTATAVVGWDATLSNGQLDELSTVLAQELLSKGAAGRFIPICFEKSVVTVVAMLAVLKAGAAFVPLDPAHPITRLREIVGDCSADIILCSPQYANLCSDIATTILPIDMRMLKNLKDTTRTDLLVLDEACLPSHPAYVIFTSGTTGKPKGTIVSHTAFCSGAAAHGPAMLMTPPFRFLQFASYTFDACLVEILTTLMMGGTVCVPREEDRTNGNLGAAMEHMGVTMALLTPSFARTLEPTAVPHLETLILGGEAMTQSHVTTWVDRVNLVNAYGPSECAVVATVNPNMRHLSNPANLGRGLGRCWIVDPHNHNRLAILGAVGELVIEGPTLSTGYLRNETKTCEAFVQDPQWALDAALRYPDTPSQGPRRMYLTGDLVRLCDDISGEMIYMGRKDASQAKLNGQRLELDEVTHHLSAQQMIRHAVVVLPKSGPCAQRLVGVISLRQIAGGQISTPSDNTDFELVISRETSTALGTIQEHLRARVPAYMVPSTWIVLRAIPLLSSGKLNRKSMIGFVEGMSGATFDKINAACANTNREDGNEETQSSTQSVSIDERLKSIWAQVLNIAPERIGRNVSFLQLGGDSITAIQVMARCRAQEIRVAVQDVIGSKSVHDLALKAGVPKEQQKLAAGSDEDHHEFDPAPIQQLYFELMGTTSEPSTGAHMQFNQSVLLRLARDIDPHEFGRGLHAIVEMHSMLRARFRRDGIGGWRQRITSDVSGSYRFKTHVLSSENRVEKRIQNSQKALDIQQGPLLAADWFDIGKEKKDVFVFIAAHHLAVDVVSWGIILQDLEDFLATKAVRPPPSLSFQAWSRGQSLQAQAEKNGHGLLPHHESARADLEYWGMLGTPNVHGDAVLAGDIELDIDTTALLLGPECHEPLHTEVLDVLLGALLLSYRKTSPGRQGCPTIYNEGHGREAWDDATDLSRTVGWFTTLYPVHLPNESSSDDDLLSAIRWVKNYRGRLVGKGRPYFAYWLLTSQGRQEYDHQWPVEVTFNYLGQMQQLSRANNLLRPVDDGERGVNSPFDIGNDVPRFALIEVSAAVTGGKMRLSFAFNKHMRHRDSLRMWVKECDSLLQQAPRLLMQHTAEQTPDEFPLLSLAYYGPENLHDRLRDIGVNLRDVSDVYPCSPMQRGLLLSTMRDPEKYAYKAVFQVQSSGGEAIDLQRLCNAWQAVIGRHPTLRTIFVDTMGDEGLMDQVVLRSAPGRIQIMSYDHDGNGQEVPRVVQKLQAIDGINCNEKKPPHRLSLCKTAGGKIFCQLEINHAICDGSSVPILLGDLAEAYDKGMVQKPAPLYRDFIAYIQSQPRSDSVRYWKGYLEGAEPCLFPALADGAANMAPSLGSYVITLDNVARLNDYCVSSGITLSTLLQFVWALVIRSYTGTDDVLFGYLASGRDVPVVNIAQGVGAFINMLVCRLHLPADTEVAEALDTMQTDLANAMAYQSCSLAEMQHELQLPVLFNTAFTYQKRADVDPIHHDHPSSSRATLEYTVLSAEDPSEYVIAVNIETTNKTVEVHFSYWNNIVSDGQIKNIAAAFDAALNDLVAKGRDDGMVGEIDLVGKAGLQQICSWNNYELPRVEQCVHQVIQQHALHRPASTPAVCGWDASFTYRELDLAAARLARHLVAILRIGPEAIVPILLEKSAWTVVAQIAVLKAGGAFVNLDPSHPDNRLAHLIQDVGAKVVLCSEKHKSKMDTLGTAAFVVDAQSIAALHHAAAPDEKPFASTAKPSNAAYIIFTSGTTGKPKGTVIEHAAFCTGAIAHAKAMFMGPDSRVLQFASYTFDASVMETLSCLLVGGCVCVPSDEDRMNDVAATIRDMGVTWTLLTPSVASTVKPESVPGLKTLVTGGEAMTAGHIARWGTQCALVNAYGPSECSVVATTSTKVDESHRVCNLDPCTIGTAVGGRAWVVDPHTPDRLVPVGAVGELLVEGRLVARGYLNNATQTAKSFIRSPKWTRDPAFPETMWLRQDNMYRTGDLVRYNSDGSISYIARKDTQVKLNGRRIELGEIESYCQSFLPDGAQAAVEVVSALHKRAATKSLAVFFSLPSSTPPRAKEAVAKEFSLLPMDGPLRKLAHAMETHLSAQLPSYMVPQLFVPISAMPWTSAGKLDRRQLCQALQKASQKSVANYKLTAAAGAPRPGGRGASEMETRLQGLWETVLGLPADSVGAADSFFRLGGDSLTAMRLVGAARAHKIMLSVLDVFEKPVLADMAVACGGSKPAAVHPPQLKPFDLVPCPQSGLGALLQDVSTQCHLSPSDIQDIYPCSPLQEGLVTLASKQAGAYVALNTLDLPAQMDLDRFKAAWQQVVNETDILRTRIVHTASSGFLQVVVVPTPIDWHDDLLLEESVAKARALGSQNGGTLVRYGIVQSHGGQGEGRLFTWAIHHALYDGWSLRLLARRVQDVYNNIELMPLDKSSYANFIHYLGQSDVAASEQFWKETLNGASAITHFPQLPPAAANEAPSFRAMVHRVKVQRSSIVINITVPTLIRAAWAIVSAAYTGMDDVVFGETLSGRNIDLPGVTETVGPTFTTVPTRLRLSNNMRLVEFLEDMHAMAGRLAPHQHLGLQHIKRLDPDCAGACDFQTLVVIQASSTTSQQDEKAGQKVDVLEADWDFQGGSSTESFFTHPLVIECNVTDTAIEATFHYNEKVLSAWQMKRLAQQFEAVVKRLVDASGSKNATLADIHVISPEDEVLLARWNRTNTTDETETAVNSCIHHLFLDQAIAQPDQVGISAWDGELTYSQIQEYASRLAAHLQKLGVTGGSLVPVCLDRSAWAIITLLAILMAEGAFVPLDPAHPLSRQAEIFDSISPSLLVCSPEHASRFSGIVATCVPVDGVMIRALPPLAPTAHNSTPGSTAYVLFTSGSTGRPKGVVVAHRDFCSSSRAYSRATRMDPSSRVFHFASLTFDAAVLEILTPLTLGACVCVPTAYERLHDLGAAMARLRATWAFLTPSVANLLDPDTVCPTLKTLVCGGEAMLAKTISRWADRVKLMNAYGPTEACVFTVVNPHVSAERDPTVIGHPTAAARVWVLDTRDGRQSRPAPVGAVGELAISGPLLARGYLNDPQKTAHVFIENFQIPLASTRTGHASANTRSTRVYRTGDLVRYRSSDGALEFVGRRDGQVKVNGQRIELGEIESRLSTDAHVRLALVLQPKKGPFKKQLVGIITLTMSTDTITPPASPSAISTRPTDCRARCNPLQGPPEHLAEARSHIAKIQGRLADMLPHYMVPAAWIVLETMPVAVSGKLDRKQVANYVEDLDHATHQHIMSSLGLLGESEEECQVTGPVKTLRDIWAKELGLRMEDINLNQSFLGLGGDSISAMGVVSRARNAELSVTIQNVLQSKSIIQLARLARQLLPPTLAREHNTKETQEPFAPSPIQAMYLRSAGNHVGEARFNQSVNLDVPRRVGIDTIKKAVHAIVQRHAMLRARFARKLDSSWEQQITTMEPSAYSCLAHSLTSRREMVPIIANAEAGLCIERGPVFRVDLFDLADHDRIAIFMVAHHLCIDMVSWRIVIQDLSQLLETDTLAVDEPPSFRSWCALQSRHINTLETRTLLPFEETPSDLDYWGIRGPLTYGTAETETFSLGEDITRLALVGCHAALRSEPVELFLTAIAHAFAKTFRDRNVPTLHIENHGREAPAGSRMDLSRTVGWFTTICPLLLTVQADGDTGDIFDTLRRTKDLRRSILEHGRPYFAHKHLSGSVDTAWSPMEILFNYLGGGVVQSLEHETDSLVRQVDFEDHEGLGSSVTTADVGPETRRLALFEISAIVVSNKLQFCFAYDSRLDQAGNVRKWIGDCKTTLEELVQGLMQRPAEPTLSDYPLLQPLTYNDLRTLTDVALPNVGIDRSRILADVEDIYSCTPVQEGMLISQLRNPTAYFFRAMYTVRHRNPHHALDAKRLAGAWQQVVDRHAALRTIFVESIRRGAVFDQVVLRKVDAGAILLSTTSDQEAVSKLAQLGMRGESESTRRKQPRLPHQLAICTTHSGRMHIQLEVNHAAIDGSSLSIIMDELASGYAGTLGGTAGPLYSDYVQFLLGLPARGETEYWMDYLKGVQPCYFPRLDSSTAMVAAATRSLRSAFLQFDRYAELRLLSEQTHVTLANIMHAAWAFVLRKYTGCDDVCFGYLTAGRDAPVENIGLTVGSLINMLCCRVQISESDTLEGIFRAAQDQHLQGLAFQHCSLAQVQHELGLVGKPLYNTSVSTQNHAEGEKNMENTILFEMEEGHDPSEYAITVNIETSKNNEGVLFRYWSDQISDKLAGGIALSMAHVLNNFISSPSQSVAVFDMKPTSVPVQFRDEQLVAEMPGDETAPAQKPSSPASASDNSDGMSTARESEQNTRTPHEEKLLELWAALLHLPEDSISGDDSFFDLGGDSITAMKLVGDARDHGLALTVADVFRHPSFRDMAASIRAANTLQAGMRSNDGTGTFPYQTADGDLYERFSLVAASNVDAFLQTSIVPQVGVFRGGISDVLPATDFQSLAVAGALLESRWMLNNFYLDGDGPMNLPQLKRACFRLVHALDILRTVFIPSGGRFLQVVLRTLRPAFHIVEIDGSPAEYSAHAQVQGADDGEPRLGEPFVEFTVIKQRTSRRHRILLRISHAQYDGVCLPRILNALQIAYRGETVPPAPSFANYLRASAGSLTSGHYEHWRQLLSGSSMTELVHRRGPNYRKSSAARATACLKKTVHLPPVESGHITTATVVKAAWAYVLAQIAATPDVVFGHTVSGRNAAVNGVESMVGPCLNLVPVRVQFGAPDWTARGLLRQVQDQQVANMSHEVLGFREIIRHCTSWPRWTYFSSTVQHQNVDQSTLLRLGDVDYQFGCASAAQEDFGDLSILSQRRPSCNNNEPDGDEDAGHMYEIILSFAEDGAIPRDVAERALDMLCDAAHLFAINPDTALPTAPDLSRRVRQVPLQEAASALSRVAFCGNTNDDTKELDAASGLRNLSQPQLLDLFTRVSTAWHHVLGVPNQQTLSEGAPDATRTTSTTAEIGTSSLLTSGALDLDTLFFDVGGDIIGLAQLSWLLANKTSVAKLRLEDLISHPTVRGHMALLAREIGASQAPIGAPIEVHKAATFPLVVPGIQRVDSPLTNKAKNFARKLTRRKTGLPIVAA